MNANNNKSELVLSTIGMSGECNFDALDRLLDAKAYLNKIISKLTTSNRLKKINKDGLVGYRLTTTSKKELLQQNKNRFEYFLSSTAETNRIKSEIIRRERLHRAADILVTMLNASVDVHRDIKSEIFAENLNTDITNIRAPCYYNGSEIKNFGVEKNKIKNGRSQGLMLTESNSYIIYNTSDALMKWNKLTEIKHCTIIKNHLSICKLNQYKSPVIGIVYAKNSDIAYEILKNTITSFIMAEGTFEKFYFLTLDNFGDFLTRVLSSDASVEKLNEIIKVNLDLKDTEALNNIENNAVDKNGNPVLINCFFCLATLKRFNTTCSIYKKKGIVVCFKNQRKAMERYCSENIDFMTIDEKIFIEKFFDD